MYSPQQQNAFVAHAQPAESGFPWRLLLLTGTILVLMIILYAGMTFGYQPYLENRLVEVEAQLKQVTSSMQAGEGEVFDVYSQLYNIQSLSKSHAYGSRLFTLFESATLPLVQLTEAEVGVAKESLSVKGVAFDYDAVVNQTASFRNAQGVVDAQLASSARNEAGRIEFQIDVQLEKGFFTKTQ